MAGLTWQPGSGVGSWVVILYLHTGSREQTGTGMRLWTPEAWRGLAPVTCLPLARFHSFQSPITLSRRSNPEPAGDFSLRPQQALRAWFLLTSCLQTTETVVCTPRCLWFVCSILHTIHKYKVLFKMSWVIYGNKLFSVGIIESHGQR